MKPILYEVCYLVFLIATILIYALCEALGS